MSLQDNLKKRVFTRKQLGTFDEIEALLNREIAIAAVQLVALERELDRLNGVYRATSAHEDLRKKLALCGINQWLLDRALGSEHIDADEESHLP